MHEIRQYKEETIDKMPTSMSREEFKSFIDKQTPSVESPINKAIELYSKIPSWIKSLPNFDKTGVTSYITDIINDECAKLDQGKNFEILFQFYEGITYLDSKINKLDSELDERVIE